MWRKKGDKQREIQGRVYNSDDYTFFVNRKDGDRVGIEPYLIKTGDFCASQRLTVREGEYTLVGRALVCRSHAGEKYSVTIRRTEGGSDVVPDLGTWPESKEGDTGFTPKRASERYPVGVWDLCCSLEKLIVPEPVIKAEGLVLITGATRSCKSEVARGLIERILRRQKHQKLERRPHLVTYEDPIEKRFDQVGKNPINPQTLGIDYTPREKLVDVLSLEDAFRNALRQTPSVFFVGEVRDSREWRAILEFAMSGHLIVATSHAGTLVEAMDSLLHAVEAKNPSERGHVAQRILAIVHQRTFDDVTIPALWRKTPAGVAALVSDGLASILPHNPDGTAVEGFATLGRRWFAKQLLENAACADDLKQKLKNKAQQFDLEGI